MYTAIVPLTPQTIIESTREPISPLLVERARLAGKFAWYAFVYAEHHNIHIQKAYIAAVKKFLVWCEGQVRELVSITPGLVGQYLVSLVGSAAKRNLALAALRGFFDRLVSRHVIILNPAASVRGVKDQVMEGKTPEMTIDQAHTLMAWIHLSETVKNEHGQAMEKPLVIGLRDRANLAELRFTACSGRGRGQTQAGGFPAR
jgi:integrase/recombinase XerD